MPKFSLRRYVRRIGQQQVRTVEEIREAPGTESLYSIQLGRDFSTREWAKESELEEASIAYDEIKSRHSVTKGLWGQRNS